MAQKVKNLPAMPEILVRSLGREDPLEEGMAAHSSIPAWRIPWTEEPDGLLQSMGSQSDITEQLTLSLSWIYLLHSAVALEVYISWLDVISEKKMQKNIRAFL